MHRGSSTGTTVAHVGIADGTGQVHGFATGPGTYVITVHGASAATQVRVTVDDDY